MKTEALQNSTCSNGQHFSFLQRHYSINLVEVVASISYAINNGYQSLGLLFGKLFFAFWVIIRLYPFLKGPTEYHSSPKKKKSIILWEMSLTKFTTLYVRISKLSNESYTRHKFFSFILFGDE
jgi:hypothetical protein